MAGLLAMLKNLQIPSPPSFGGRRENSKTRPVTPSHRRTDDRNGRSERRRQQYLAITGDRIEGRDRRQEGGSAGARGKVGAQRVGRGRRSRRPKGRRIRADANRLSGSKREAVVTEERGTEPERRAIRDCRVRSRSDQHRDGHFEDRVRKRRDRRRTEDQRAVHPDLGRAESLAQTDRTPGAFEIIFDPNG